MKFLKLYVLIALLGFISFGCAPKLTKAQLEEKYGTNAPAIVKYGAADRVTAGKPWRVYLSAEDPDGDMSNLIFEIYVPGKGPFPAYWKRLGPDMSKSFTGYFYLNTPKISTAKGADYYFVTMQLRVKILDKVDRASEEIVIPFRIVTESVDPTMPENFSQDENQALGPIMIRLHTRNRPGRNVR